MNPPFQARNPCRLALAGAAFAAAALPFAARACLSDAAAQAQAAGPADLWVNGANQAAAALAANCGRTVATACRHPALAINQAGPGTTMHILPLANGAAYTDPIYIYNKQGSLAKPILIRGEGPANAKTRIWTTQGNAIMLDGMRNDAGTGDNALAAAACVAYITIQNLDLKGTRPSGAPSAHGGIALKKVHHVNIWGNTVHDSSGGGIGSWLSDQVQIQFNTVYGNSKDTTGGSYTSGISAYQSQDLLSGPHHMIISHNWVYGNTNGVPASGRAINLDGNGIIIDDGRHTQAPGNKVAKYSGSTSVFNNVVYGNGGRGIHVFSSENVLVASNTVLNNMTDAYNVSAHQGEIESLDSSHVMIYANITSADAKASHDGTRHYAISVINQAYSGSAIVVDHNLTWNARQSASEAIFRAQDARSSSQIGTGNIFGNPLFVAATTTPYTSAALHVKAGSPALGFGVTPRTALGIYTYALKDLEGVNRPLGTAVTAGAYQTPTK